MNEINELIKSVKRPVSEKQVMILRIKFNKRILEKAKWYQVIRKIRAIRDILDALNYLTRDEVEKTKIESIK